MVYKTVSTLGAQGASSDVFLVLATTDACLSEPLLMRKCDRICDKLAFMLGIFSIQS